MRRKLDTEVCADDTYPVSTAEATGSGVEIVAVHALNQRTPQQILHHRHRCGWICTMKLTGRQIQQIRDALLDAYPTADSLRMMVRIELEQELAAIAGGENQRVLVFNLVSWAERNGCVQELIAGAYEEMPGNRELRRLARWWRLFVSQGAEQVVTSPLEVADGTRERASIDLFLSYSRRDTDAMHVVLDVLRGAGLAVWTDAGIEPGTQDWEEAISEALDQAPAMVVLLSPNAKASRWVRREIVYAQGMGEPIYPVLICGDEAHAVPLVVAGVQWVDGRTDLARAVQEELLPTLEKAMAKLVLQPAAAPTSIIVPVADKRSVQNASPAYPAAVPAVRTDIVQAAPTERSEAAPEEEGAIVVTPCPIAAPTPKSGVDEAPPGVTRWWRTIPYPIRSWIAGSLLVLLVALVVGMVWIMVAPAAGPGHGHTADGPPPTATPAGVNTASSDAVYAIAAPPTGSPTGSPVSTAMSSMTDTATTAPIAIPVATSTSTGVPTATPTAAAPAPTAAPSPTETLSAAPTATPTLTPTAISTATFTPSTMGTVTVTPTRNPRTPPPAKEIEFVAIPAGPIVIGAQDSEPLWRDNEKPPAAVNLAAFAISRTEVTNGQYARCVHARGCTAPANNVWEKPGYANYPVTHVTWEQANDFAAFVGGRLPTEAEWEKACRGPDGYNYPWSYAYPTRELANYHEYIGGITPVEMFSPKGDSAYGLADMAGNVWEWTSSQYRTYPYVVDDGRENQEEDALRVQRGGAWMTRDDAYLRCAARVGVSQGRSQNNIGFRVAR